MKDLFDTLQAALTRAQDDIGDSLLDPGRSGDYDDEEIADLEAEQDDYSKAEVKVEALRKLLEAATVVSKMGPAQRGIDKALDKLLLAVNEVNAVDEEE